MTHTAKQAVRIGALVAILGWSTVALWAIEPTVDLTDRTYGSGEVAFELAQTTLAAGNDPGVGVTIASGADVTFVAGTSVTLRSGFRVQQGGTFRAAIGQMNTAITANTDWSQKTYLGGDVVVAAGVSLDINGAEVVVLPGSTLTVHGDLLATDACRFTSLVTDPTATDAWRGIVVTGSAMITTCEIHYARQAIRVDGDGQLHVQSAVLGDNLIGLHVLGHAPGHRPLVAASQFTNNRWYAVKEDATGDAAVRHSAFSGNGNLYYELEDTLLTIDTLNNQSGSYGNTEQ